MKRLGDAAGAVGRGLLAGAIGTAAMTVSSTAEMKMRGRGGSSAPSDAAGKVLGVQPRNPAGEARFANVAHWGYGTALGAIRGLLDVAGLDGTDALAAHFAAVYGSEQVILPALDVAPPLWEWGITEVAIDAFHHGVYAVATSAAYTAITE